MDVDVAQLDAAHHDAVQGDTAEPGLSQVHVSKLRAAEVDILEPGAPEVLMGEFRHASTVASPADNAGRRKRKRGPGVLR